MYLKCAQETSAQQLLRMNCSAISIAFSTQSNMAAQIIGRWHCPPFQHLMQNSQRLLVRLRMPILITFCKLTPSVSQSSSTVEIFERKTAL